MLPYNIRDAVAKGTEALHSSPTSIQHSIDELNSLKVAIRRSPTVGTNTAIPRVTKAGLACIVAPPTSCHPSPSTHVIFTITAWIMIFEYLTALKKYRIWWHETKIDEASITYKGMEWLCGHPSPLQKKVKDYVSVASTFLTLRKIISLCHYPKDVGKEKAMYTE